MSKSLSLSINVDVAILLESSVDLVRIMIDVGDRIVPNMLSRSTNLTFEYNSTKYARG